MLNKPVVVYAVLLFFSVCRCYGIADKKQTSTKNEAEAYVNNITKLDSSKIWPGINPGWFLKNLKSNITHPITVYPGDGTYFCAYSAITYAAG